MTTIIPLRDRAKIIDELAGMRERDTKWRDGRVFSLVYHAGEAHEELLKAAHAQYASANLLNPMAFPSLARMEREVIEIAGRLFHCAGAVGTLTSGGTESIMCAVAAYRDRARREKPWIRSPELVVPTTIHPAFDKAAHYLGVKLVKVPLRDDFRADPKAMAKAITWRTIGMCASAPQYPHGVVDPIAELGAICAKKKIPLHVDACVGGWILPWLEKLGRDVPKWDFRVPGVTSISADLHKFAYAGKGASVLVWRSMDQMKHQIFVATDFPGGIYASPTLIGTRPGGPIAAAWAALHAIGDEGYLALAKTAAETADRFRAGLRALGLDVVGAPHSTIVTWRSPDLDVYAVADRMETRGWTIDRQHRPATIHLTVTANHAGIVDQYLADLKAALAEVKADPKLAKSGSAPMYGMAAKLPVRFLVARQVRGLIAGMYARTSEQHRDGAR